MKVFDLSTNSEVVLFTLNEIARQCNYAGEAVLKDLMNDPEIETPTPDHTINGTDYWKQNSVDLWKIAYDLFLNRENQRRATKLEEGKIAFTELIDILIKEVKRVKRLNHGAFKHNRGNSLQDARMRLVNLGGAVDFVTAVLASVDLNYTDEQRVSIHQQISEMKAAVQMR